MSTLVPVLLAEMLLAMLAVVTGKRRREKEGLRERGSGRKGLERENNKGGGKKKQGRKKRARKVKWEGRCREG